MRTEAQLVQVDQLLQGSPPLDLLCLCVGQGGVERPQVELQGTRCVVGLVSKIAVALPTTPASPVSQSPHTTADGAPSMSTPTGCGVKP